MKQFVIILASAFVLYSCGGGSDQTKSTTTTPDATETPTDKAAPEAVTLTIEGDDQMKYNKDELRVKEGQEVTLILKHVGKLEKQAMGHNWVLLKRGVDVQEFAMEAIQANDNDYIPAGTNKVIVHTDMIGGGEETQITFTAPKKGTYDYICTFPGHFGTMHGKLIVE